MAEETTATETPTKPEVPKKKTPQEEHKELQGKKKTSKKKIKYYSKTEAIQEIERLDKANHQTSKY